MKKKRLFVLFQLLKKRARFLKITKICLVLVLFFNLNLLSSVYSQKNLVSLDLKDVTVEEFVSALKEQTTMRFMYNSSIINELDKVSVKVNKKDIEEVLKDVLSEVNLEYEIHNNVILIRNKEKTRTFQQSIVKVKGTVTDENGSPIPGVTVMLKGGTQGTATDVNGKYELQVPATNQEILIFSFVGMKSTEVSYTGQEELNIILKEDIEDIGEVVVNGYFTRKKESYTGVSSTFTGAELRKVSTGNILNTLSILDPSFTRVVNNEMGSNPNVLPNFEIRGSSSLKSEFESYANLPTFIMDGFEVSAEKVFDLDPTRVKFITVLKDAAATAIYGSRAANGVVIIETELPQPGKLRLSYNGSMNLEVADLSDYNLMNAEEKLEYEVRAGLYPISTNISSTENNLENYNNILKLVKEGNDVDWLAIPVRDLGIGHKHSVIAEGGDEIIRYALDLFYSNKIGIMKGSKRDNFGGGLRLQYRLKNLKFTNYTSFDHLKSVNSPYGNFEKYLKFNPYYNPYDEDGNIKRILYEYRYYDLGFHTRTMYNELYNAKLPSKDESYEDRFLNNFSVEYDIIEGLKLKANLSISVDNGREDIYKPYEHTDFLDKELKGNYIQTSNRDFTYDINIIINYFKEINKHSFNAGVVYNLRESTLDKTTLLAEGFPNANMNHISMAIKYKEGGKPSGAYDITRLIGLVGNINYSFDNRFLLDLSIRSDGSSMYGSNNRWGTFWSVGLGYNLHNEQYIRNLSFINLFKIRGSIGTTGGQKFNPYQSMAIYSYDDERINDISYSGFLGAILKAFGNDNLKWQRVEKRNIGFDFELFERRLTGSFNYYSDISKNLLVDVTIAPSLGFNSYKENLGKVENYGVDLTLRGGVIRNVNKNLRWDLIFNLAHNKNKIMEINKALQAFNDEQDKEVDSKPRIRYKEGLSQNTIWANESLGIDPVTGDEIFLDMQGNKTNKWSSANFKPFGSTDPKVYGNFGTTFTYQNWELNAYFYYRCGGYIYNQTLVDKVENVNPNENGDRRILYDRWNKPGDVAKFKKVADVSVTEPTSRFVEKENYVQFQSLAISYDFSGKGLQNFGISRLRLSAIGNDIFTSSTVRMERGTLYPFARTFSLSAQLTF